MWPLGKLLLYTCRLPLNQGNFPIWHPIPTTSNVWCRIWQAFNESRKFLLMLLSSCLRPSCCHLHLNNKALSYTWGTFYVSRLIFLLQSPISFWGLGCQFSILLVFNFVSFVSYSCVSIFLPFCGLPEQFLEFKLNFSIVFLSVCFGTVFSAVVL